MSQKWGIILNIFIQKIIVAFVGIVFKDRHKIMCNEKSQVPG